MIITCIHCTKFSKSVLGKTPFELMFGRRSNRTVQFGGLVEDGRNLVEEVDIDVTVSTVPHPLERNINAHFNVVQSIF